MISLNKIKSASWSRSWASGLLISCSLTARSPQSQHKPFHLRAAHQSRSTATPLLLPKHEFSAPHPAEKPENHKVYVSFRAYLYNNNKNRLWFINYRVCEYFFLTDSVRFTVQNITQMGSNLRASEINIFSLSVLWNHKYLPLRRDVR